MVSLASESLIGYYAFASVINLAFGALFLHLRARADPGTLTKSQRWGLTLLGTIFLLNGLALLSEGLTPIYVWGVQGNIYNLVSLVAVVFSLVYPRPITSWKNMDAPLMALGMVGLIIVTGPAFFGNTAAVVSPIGGFLYLIAFTIQPLILLWWSTRESSEQSRMLMVLIAWGMMFNTVCRHTEAVLTVAFRMSVPGVLFSNTDNFLFFLLLALTAYLTYKRRGNLGDPEKFNLIIFGTAAAFGIISFFQSGSSQNLSPQLTFVHMMLKGSWVWVRPLLLAFALLRYQLFGVALRVDRLLLWLGWLVLDCLAAVCAAVAFSSSPPDIAATAFIVTGIVAAYPAFLASRYLIGRYLPLSAGDVRVNVVQQRSAYLLCLQTAVHDGELRDDFDRRVLQNLRKRLGISDREHELLLSSFPRKQKSGEPFRIQEIFLMLRDGRLVAHAGTFEEEKELIAGMLTAIRGFAADGLKAGQKELDTVKYGDYTLITESEGKLVIAALVIGPETSALRVLLRDRLAEAGRLCGTVLQHWDGQSETVEGLQPILASALG